MNLFRKIIVINFIAVILGPISTYAQSFTGQRSITVEATSEEFPKERERFALAYRDRGGSLTWFVDEFRPTIESATDRKQLHPDWDEYRIIRAVLPV